MRYKIAELPEKWSFLFQNCKTRERFNNYVWSLESKSFVFRCRGTNSIENQARKGRKKCTTSIDDRRMKTLCFQDKCHQQSSKVI